MKKKKAAAKKATIAKKPAARSEAAKKSGKKLPPTRSTGANKSESAPAARGETYAPPPVQGIGWKPFRYPPE